VLPHETNRDRKPLLKNCRNQMVWFGKPECPVLSGPTAVRGAVEFRRGAPPLAKRCLDDGEA
jgi:hypothetical protein